MIFFRRVTSIASLNCALLLSACVTHDPGLLPPDGFISPASDDYDPNAIDAYLSSVDHWNPKESQTVPEIGAEEDEINLAIKKGIPLEVNAEVEKWIEFFTVRRPDLFQRYLDRGEEYKSIILPLLKDQDVPSEIFYLALIESGFVLNARSHASAVGLWQFIAATGRRYGLRIDNYVDERLDPHRSTIAATLYLNDLRNVFDSWYLAMAAYNAGEMRIMRAIMKGKTRDFWELARNRQLPSETMNYIPKFLAAVIIGSEPEKYGFSKPEPVPAQEIASVTVPAGIQLDKVAEVLNVPIATLKKHNRYLRQNMTPPGVPNYRIWVPSEYEPLFADAEEKLRPFATRVAVTNKSQSQTKGGASTYHTVRRGETLSSIANRYGMTLTEIRRLNNMRGSRILAGSRLRVHAAGSVGSKVSGRSSKPAFHRVRRGENLTLIARKYGTTVATLKQANNLRSNRIYPGMRLKLNQQVQSTYRVKRGDNLTTIARRFGLTVAELKRMNQLRRNTIHAGQVLTVSSDRG